MVYVKVMQKRFFIILRLKLVIDPVPSRSHPVPKIPGFLASRPVSDPDLPRLNPVPSRDKKHTPKNTPPPKFLYP